VTVNNKFVSVSSRKACRESRCVPSLILNLGTR